MNKFAELFKIGLGRLEKRRKDAPSLCCCFSFGFMSCSNPGGGDRFLEADRDGGGGDAERGRLLTREIVTGGGRPPKPSVSSICFFLPCENMCIDIDMTYVYIYICNILSC